MLAERTGLSAYGLKVLFVLTYGLKQVKSIGEII